MSYDIFFLRRDPGQSFEDALDELESGFEETDPVELSDEELEMWDELVARAREILGDVDVSDDEDSARELTARDTRVELLLISGEAEIHVPQTPPGVDEVDLMSTVYELARAVEEVTGLEGYDPQLGEPVSTRSDIDAAEPRAGTEAGESDEDGSGRRGATVTPERSLVGDPRPDMAPDHVDGEQPRRRWWEFWRA